MKEKQAKHGKAMECNVMLKKWDMHKKEKKTKK